MTGTFLQAAVILLREGLEALLVIAALAAYLGKVGAHERLPALYAGAGGAVVASFLAAWGFETFNNGAHSDVLEGVIILFAAAIMLYVSGWLLVRQDPRAWQGFLKSKADEALAKRTGIAVAVLAFLAVFREGAETVLFVHALAKTSGGFGANLLAGLAAAAIVLVVLFFVINLVARWLPLRPLFLATSAFLFFMAVKFIGEGIQEFQEQQLVGYTEIRGGSGLSAIGFNPTVEAVALQLAVILFAAATFIALDRRGRQAAAAAAKADKRA
jgi:high-affinity iron transporter